MLSIALVARELENHEINIRPGQIFLNFELL